MDSQFQPAFIPKKTLAQPTNAPRRSINLVSLVIILIFLTVVAMGVGVFVYKIYIQRNNDALSKQLRDEVKKFEPSFIAEATRLDTRIQSTQKLLKQHLALTAFFDQLGAGTLKKLRFSGFKYEIRDKTVVISMSGQASSFSEIALQEEEFNKPEYQNIIKKPTFANLNLDKDGNVTFDFNATLNTDSINYGKILSSVSAADSSASVQSSDNTSLDSSNTQTTQ